MTTPATNIDCLARVIATMTGLTGALLGFLLGISYCVFMSMVER